MGETMDFEAVIPSERGIPLHLGNRQIWLNADTTTIWRHGDEDRHFDHCVIEIDGQTSRLFGLDEPLCQELEERHGCRVIDDFPIADTETRADYDTWASGGLDDLEAFGHAA